MRRRTKALQFDVRCKVIGRNFDCGCRFLYNGATLHFRSKNGYAILIVMNIIWSRHLNNRSSTRELIVTVS